MIRKLGAILVALTLVLTIGLTPGVALAENDNDCVRYGQGYWKQWLADPDPEWECAYGFSAEFLLGILNTPARGNPTQILLYQFIAAALNVGVNECELPVSPCDSGNVLAAFLAALGHLELYLDGNDSGATRSEILGWKDTLEIWNKGYDPGVLSAENSHAEFTDNADGTGTLTVVLRDAYGCPVYYPQRYFRAETQYTPSGRYYYIGGSILTYATRAHHEGDGVYTFVLTKPCGWDDIWNIAIAYGTTTDRVVIHEGLDINIEYTPFMEGYWDVDLGLVGSTWQHVMFVDWHDADGSLTGYGGFPRHLEPDFTHEWDIVAGEVRCFTDKSTGTWIDVIEVDITIVYTTANAGYSLRFVGTLDFETGEITGDVSGDHSGTFSAIKR